MHMKIKCLCLPPHSATTSHSLSSFWSSIDVNERHSSEKDAPSTLFYVLFFVKSSSGLKFGDYKDQIMIYYFFNSNY